MIYSIALQVGFLPLDQPRPIEREYTYNVGLSRWLSGKGSTCQRRRCRFHPSVGKIPWRRKWQPTPVLLPGKPQRQMSLAEDSPWGHRVRHNFVTKNNDNKRLMLGTPQEVELSFPVTFKEDQVLHPPTSNHEFLCICEEHRICSLQH